MRAKAFVDGQNHCVASRDSVAIAIAVSARGTLFTGGRSGRFGSHPAIATRRPCIVLGRVDVEQQSAVAIEGRQLIRAELPHREIHQRVADTQIAGLDPGMQVPGDPAGIRGAQRMTAASSRGTAASASRPAPRGTSETAPSETACRSRSPAPVPSAPRQRRVKAAERPRAGDAIGHDRNVHGRTRDLSLVDDQEMWSEPAQQRQLPIEDRAGADDQRALVDAAEPPRLAAGENGCCPGRSDLH